MTTTTATREAVDTAKSIRIAIGVVDEQPFLPMSITDLDFSQFRLPDGLEQQLEVLGLPPSTVTHLSTIYLRKAEEFNVSSVQLVRSACSKLDPSIDPSADLRPLTKLQRQVFDIHLRHHQNTLAGWREELLDLVRSSTTLISAPLQTPAATAPEAGGKRRRRQFKSEYLPLFEFAFEQDRFPSREDKKHLARISGMSYRQVNVWFQNRRCRQPSRTKSHRTASSSRTFEDMRALLGPSAQAALLESTPLTKKLNPDLVDPPATGAPVLMQHPLRSTHAPEVIVLDDDVSSPVADTRGVLSDAAEVVTMPGSTTRISLEDVEVTTTPVSTTRAVSLGATDDGFASDERDDSSDEEFLGTSMPQRSAIVDGRSSPPQKQNPLNCFRTPVYAFPTPYAPSQLTSNPFIIEHHPWLRDPRTNPKKFINPAPEAITEIMDDFDHMDVDDPDATVNATGEQLNSSPRQRIISTGSSVIWSSEESTATSRTSSYSLSVQSSPRFSDSELPSPTECISFKTAEYTSSPVAEKSSLEAETAEDDKTAGPSAAPLAEATPSKPSIPNDIPSVDLKCEALLASAA